MSSKRLSGGIEELRRREETERRLVDIARRCLVRDERKAKQNQAKLSQIAADVDPGKPGREALEAAVLKPNHFFIHEGSLMVVSKKKGPRSRYFWLFDDCLLEGRAFPAAAVAFEGAPRFVLRHILSAPVALLLAGTDTFQVITREKRFTVRAAATEEREAWANAFRLVVGGAAELDDDGGGAQVRERKQSIPLPGHSPGAHGGGLGRSKHHVHHGHGHGHHAKAPLAVAAPVTAEEDPAPPASEGEDQSVKEPPTLALTTQYCMRCGENLSVPRRRHYCANCGKVVCPSCSEYRVLPHLDPEKTLLVCQFCLHLPHLELAPPTSPTHRLLQPPPPPSDRASPGLMPSKSPPRQLSALLTPTSAHKQRKAAAAALLFISSPPLHPQQPPRLTMTPSPTSGGEAEEDLPQTFVGPTELPLSISPLSLTFGGAKVPVDAEVSEYLNLVNRTGIDYRFRFLPQRSTKYKISFEPVEGCIRLFKTKKVKVKLVVFCTTNLSFDVSVLVWRERMQSPAIPGNSSSSIALPEFSLSVTSTPTPAPAPAPAPSTPSSTAPVPPTEPAPAPPSLPPLLPVPSPTTAPAVQPESVPVTVLESLRRGVAGKVSVVVESQQSSKIDGDELTLCAPAVGDGAYGAVYKGTYRGTEVAVKVLKNQADWSMPRLEDFLREVRFLETVRHPCVIDFVGAVHKPGELAIVTMFCPLGNLTSAMKKHNFSYPLRVKCVLDTARGMEYLHRNNIMHRDLKPSNLLVVSLDAQSPDPSCKISDFGTIRDLNTVDEAKLTRRVGSVMWMAPEVLADAPYDKPADVFSFAIIVLEVVAGVKPYAKEDDPSGIWRSVEISKFISERKRLQIPLRTPLPIVSIISESWNHEPRSRPTFATLVPRLEKLLVEALASE